MKPSRKLWSMGTPDLGGSRTRIEVKLDLTSEAPAAARAAAREVASEFDAGVAEAYALIASEVVSASVRDGSGKCVRLRLSSHPGVLIGVIDTPSGGWSEQPVNGLDLAQEIIDLLADGWRLVWEPTGLNVWFWLRNEAR